MGTVSTYAAFSPSCYLFELSYQLMIKLTQGYADQPYYTSYLLLPCRRELGRPLHALAAGTSARHSAGPAL